MTRDSWFVDIFQISPDSCTCRSGGESCVNVEDLSEGLNLSHFPDSCSSSAYLWKNLRSDMSWMHNTLFIQISGGALTHSNCCTWMTEFIQPCSDAYSSMSQYCPCNQSWKHQHNQSCVCNVISFIVQMHSVNHIYLFISDIIYCCCCLSMSPFQPSFHC